MARYGGASRGQTDARSALPLSQGVCVWALGAANTPKPPRAHTLYDRSFPTTRRLPMKYIFGAAISLVIAFRFYAETRGISSSLFAQSLGFYIACFGVLLGLVLYWVTEKRPLSEDPNVYIMLMPVIAACMVAMQMYNISDMGIAVVGTMAILISYGALLLLRRYKFLR